VTDLRRAVFLDRDGTLLEEANYIAEIERLAFFPYSSDAVRLLNRAGLAVVVITNQAGIARGIVDESFVGVAHAAISARLAEGGAHVDAYYYCPHHPQGIVEAFRRACDCRKPQPGMLRRAADDLGLDLGASFVVGDKLTDVEAGHAVGARAVLVRTGFGRKEEALPGRRVEPDAIVDNLMGAVSWILQA
jgi:D-glycero-D-manno-heptose 1,7-bisphosphate phosphatase